MRPLDYSRVASVTEAAGAIGKVSADTPPTVCDRQFIAGGTNILDYMKLSAWQAKALVDINDLDATLGAISAGPEGLHLGALVRMTDCAAHPVVARDYPAIAESLLLAATNQIRNMASLAGNVLQRTRCSYFRDVDYPACNKRQPGSGCAALGGNNRTHAVLGVTDACIASYPGDYAQALMALDATVSIDGHAGKRTIPFAKLHVPAGRPDKETVLAPGEVITGFFVPAGPHTRRSTYVKVRDRQSYAYALASVAAALVLQDDKVHDVRIALGGVAYHPWRAQEAEVWLKGKALDEESAMEAGRLAFHGAVTHGQNDYKPELGARTVARALLQVAAKEVA